MNTSDSQLIPVVVEQPTQHPIPVIQAPSSATLSSLVVRWLFGQEATTVALFAILFAIGWFAKYYVDVAQPALAADIQDGYERMDAKHAARVEDLSKMFERQGERWERSNANTERLLREIFTEQKTQGREQRNRDAQREP